MTEAGKHTYSGLRRPVAIALLSCGLLAMALYAAVAVVFGFLDDSQAAGRFRGMVYLSGLLVVPLALVLVVAGGGLLIGKKRRRR